MEAGARACRRVLEVGARVFKRGRGHGVVALDNEDGTWNVEFDDDGAEGDFKPEDGLQRIKRLRCE